MGSCSTNALRAWWADVPLLLLLLLLSGQVCNVELCTSNWTPVAAWLLSAQRLVRKMPQLCALVRSDAEYAEYMPCVRAAEADLDNGQVRHACCAL